MSERWEWTGQSGGLMCGDKKQRGEFDDAMQESDSATGAPKHQPPQPLLTALLPAVVYGKYM